MEKRAAEKCVSLFPQLMMPNQAVSPIPTEVTELRTHVSIY